MRGLLTPRRLHTHFYGALFLLSATSAGADAGDKTRCARELFPRKHSLVPLAGTADFKDVAPLLFTFLGMSPPGSGGAFLQHSAACTESEYRNVPRRARRRQQQQQRPWLAPKRNTTCFDFVARREHSHLGCVTEMWIPSFALSEVTRCQSSESRAPL